MPEYSIIGSRVPRVDALAKVTGSALYSADMYLPNMLFGKVLWSPYARALIHRLDINRAQALDGVMAVITDADVPVKKDTTPNLNPMTSCMAGDRVIFAGQPIAAVAAINAATAEEAISLIEVDYEELPPVVDVLEAMKPDSPLVHPDSCTLNLPDKEKRPSNIFWQTKNNQGDIDGGFRQADIVLENTFRTQTVHHGYIEPRASLASVDLNGKVTVWTDCQGIFEARELIAEFMGLPLNYVKVIPVEIGGAFGGKSHQVISPLCVLLSKKSRHPVKIVLTREEVFKTNRPAPASVSSIKAGVKKDGTLTAVSLSMIYDYGALHGMGGMFMAPIAIFTGLGPYRIPNLKVECYSVYTNKTPSGPYRGPTAPQAAFAVESQMDLLARALNMDPLELRLKNIASEGDPMPNGMPLPKVGFRETIEKMQGYLKEKGPLEGENRGRGIAMGFWPPAGGPAAAHINVNADGTIVLSIGSVDISGTRTSLAQLVAEEFGIPIEKVTVVTGDTETAPYSIMSVGSMITRSLSVPVCEACQDVKNQLSRIAASQLKAEEMDVEFVHGHVRIKGMPDKSISLEDLAGQTVGFQGKGPITGRGANKGLPPAPVLAVGMADIEVDRETGKIKILSYAAAQDVGRAINPAMIEGQIQGAVVQGIGWALYENHISEKGVMQNANLLDYRIPTAVNVPYIDTMLVEVDSKSAPYGIRGVGEPPMVPTLAVIANAVHDAIGIRLKELPMDPETVILALRKEKNIKMWEK
jgi:xanthine dehydrogenase molybdenum-binding subunit